MHRKISFNLASVEQLASTTCIGSNVLGNWLREMIVKQRWAVGWQGNLSHCSQEFAKLPMGRSHLWEVFPWFPSLWLGSRNIDREFRLGKLYNGIRQCSLQSLLPKSFNYSSGYLDISNVPLTKCLAEGNSPRSRLHWTRRSSQPRFMLESSESRVAWYTQSKSFMGTPNFPMS